MAAHDRVTTAIQVPNAGPKGHMAKWESLKQDSESGNFDLIAEFQWANRNWIHERQAKGYEMLRTQVFTDGSKTEHGTGSGFVIYRDRVEIGARSFKLPDHASVYQAELVALEEASKEILRNGIPGPISIHTDSLSSIQALKSFEVKSRQCKATMRALDDLATHRRVTMYWVRAHQGQMGNERADTLAKQGTRSLNQRGAFVGAKASKAKYQSIAGQIWDQEWETIPVGRRTKTWLPKRDPKKSKKLTRLERPHLSLCTQWITGFCNLMRHRHKKNPATPDKCRLCGRKRETPSHLSFYCPVLARERHEFFSTISQDKENWTPQDMANFITQTVCMDLMVDHTNYDESFNSDEDVE